MIKTGREDVVVEWSNKCRSNNAVLNLKGTTVSCNGQLAVYPGFSNDRPR